METAEDKLSWLAGLEPAKMKFAQVEPDKNASWIEHPENTWDAHLPVADKRTKSTDISGQDRAIFKLFSFGLVTNRDDWVYGLNDKELRRNTDHLVERYEIQRTKNREIRNRVFDEQDDSQIKWTRSVLRSLSQNTPFNSSGASLVDVSYRPFDKRRLLFYPLLIEMLNQRRTMFGPNGRYKNTCLAYSDPTSQKPFMAIASDNICDMHLVGAASGASCLPRYRFSTSGERIDNITDWAVNKFAARYGKSTKITKDDIFSYVYAVLHDPIYRETYAINLKREFPRIPLYPQFQKWRDWGQ